MEGGGEGEDGFEGWEAGCFEKGALVGVFGVEEEYLPEMTAQLSSMMVQL